MDVIEQTEDIKPVESVKKLSGQLAISNAGTVLPRTMSEVTELAQYMAKAAEMLPKHLRANPAMCMGVIMDAIAWRMNPFRLATQHMVVNGVGSYMSQAITGIINQNAVIQGRLVPEYTGAGESLICKLRPPSREGQILPYDSPKLGEITPKNSPLWKTDPHQQLFYYSARAWCRRYFPELLMGVYDPDEARSMKDITPAGPVENYLEDEPEMHVEVRVAGEGGELVHKGTAETAAEFVQEKKKIVETNYTAEEITPEEVIDKITKAINAHTDAILLEQWQHDNHGAINSLPPDILKQVRKALADKLFELEG
jgi:hypothetical protein